MNKMHVTLAVVVGLIDLMHEGKSIRTVIHF